MSGDFARKRSMKRAAAIIVSFFPAMPRSVAEHLVAIDVGDSPDPLDSTAIADRIVTRIQKASRKE